MVKITMQSQHAKFAYQLFEKVHFINWADMVMANTVREQLLVPALEYDAIAGKYDNQRADLKTNIEKIKLQLNVGNAKEKAKRSEELADMVDAANKLDITVKEEQSKLTTFVMDRDALQFYLERVEKALSETITFDKEYHFIGLSGIRVKVGAAIYSAMQVALHGEDTNGQVEPATEDVATDPSDEQ